MADILEAGLEAVRRRSVVTETELKKKTVRPINGWVLIRKIVPKDIESEGGVVVTQGQERSQMGEVVAASKGYVYGNGVEIPAPCQVGDVVIYTNYPIELDDIQRLTEDKLLHLVRFEEIFGIVEDAEEVAT